MLTRPSLGVIVLVAAAAEGVVEVLEEVVVGTLVVDLVGAVVVAVIVVGVVVLEVVVEDVEASTNQTWLHREQVSSDIFLLHALKCFLGFHNSLSVLSCACRKENYIQR